MIQDKNRNYFLLKSYVDFLLKLAYRRVEYCGYEKIPRDGAVIYTPNHSNTLMDALVMLAIDKEAKVFVARADIFKNPVILKILTFLKMLPINRARDGRSSLAQNEEINRIVVEVLRDKVPFCILPEGTHRPKHSLMPLQKGLFRIALQANEAFGSKMPVYIVPEGIEFGHFFRYRSSLLVQIGEPINVTQFVREHPELTVNQQINALRDELTDRIKQVMLQIPDDENYDATLELVRLFSKEQSRRMNLKEDTLINRFTAGKEIIRKVETSLEFDSPRTRKLLEMAGDFARKRRSLGIGMASILQSHIRWAMAGKIILILLGLPYFIFSAVATSPITLLSVWLCSKFKDNAFHNSVRFLIMMVLYPILLLLLGITVAVVFSWLWGLVFSLLFIPSFFFLHDYARLMRLLISAIKWLINKDLRKQYKDIKNEK